MRLCDILCLICLFLMVSIRASLSQDLLKDIRAHCDRPELAIKLDSAFQMFIDQEYLSGGVAMIAYQDEIFYQRAFGMQSIKENQHMQINSLFRIASMTKPITAAAIMLLVEEGKLQLDDKVEKFIPEMRKMKVLESSDRLEAPRRPVTIRHLLMHTSGTRSRADPWFSQHGIDFSKTTTLAEYVDMLLQAPLVFHPGEGFNYAMNNDICARVIEVLSGQDFGTFLRDRLLNPLEMKDTWYQVPETALDRLCSIYAYDQEGLHLVEGKEPVQSEFARGNGQWVSTATDYMNFLKMLMNGGVFEGNQILKASSVEQLITDALPASIELKVGPTVFPKTGFGLSVAISRSSSEPWKPLPVKFENLFQHLPAGCFLWPGITNTYFWADPSHEVYGVVFSQSTNPALIGNFQTFTQEFYSYFFEKDQ